MSFIDLTNTKFGRLTVLERVGSNKHKTALWKCLCDCGNTIITNSNTLRVGNSKSCGCLQKEIVAFNNKRNDVRRKNSLTNTGKKKPIGSKIEAGENNHKAKIWIISKDGKNYRFTNLANFIRENQSLFEKDDLKPYKSRKDKCRARVMIQNLFLMKKNNEPRIPSFNWKGWKPVNKQEKRNEPTTISS